MPLIGPVPEGRTFFCPHCGALYKVVSSKVRERQRKWTIRQQAGRAKSYESNRSSVPYSPHFRPPWACHFLTG
jgi:hypothetical protein